MEFKRIVTRTLPNGKASKVYPFHISLEGLESNLLCRDDEDYDHLVKSFLIGSYKHNCIIIIYIAMSNHGHIALLSEDMNCAYNAARSIKKRHSQYLSWKYNEKSLLARSDISVKYLDSDSYLRNALAYIPRNALDAGSRIEDYPWSSYRGVFSQGRCPSAIRSVSSLSRRERESIFRTHEDLNNVPWLLNAENNVEPASACDYQYLESAFKCDQAFFLRTIGSLNLSQMRQQLVVNGRIRQTDTEMLAVIKDMADRWFHKPMLDLTPEQKARMLPYLYRSYRTSIPQLARCLSMNRNVVSGLLSSSEFMSSHGNKMNTPSTG